MVRTIISFATKTPKKQNKKEKFREEPITFPSPLKLKVGEAGFGQT